MPLPNHIRCTLLYTSCPTLLPTSLRCQFLQPCITNGLRFRSHPSSAANKKSKKQSSRSRDRRDVGDRHDKRSESRRRYTPDKRRGNDFSPAFFRQRLVRTPENLIPQLGQCLDELHDELLSCPLLETLRKEDEERSREHPSREQIWKNFVRSVLLGGGDKAFAQSSAAARERLLKAHLLSRPSLVNRVKHEFYHFILSDRFSPADLKKQRELCDMSFPSEWYPGTRAMKRKIHLHVGPTNSGKTYHALERLRQAKSGIFAGPLRLLAHEVYTRLNTDGYPCALITGEERRRGFREDGTEITGDVVENIRSFTVEMLPLNSIVDVAVIDEIQMLGDDSRGWAWTQALLGVRAKELHLCGEERAVDLVRAIAASVGDEVHVHRYERLSPLRMADESLKGDLGQLRKGDAVICFSVIGIHVMRQRIEKATGKKAAIVYGALPPETRAQQARLFNDPDSEYDFLVASDAVGMGINLAIKRVIFETSYKWNGFREERLSVSSIKQIGGRAGRFRVPGNNSSADTAGVVTTLEDFDFQTIAEGMASPIPPIQEACILPPLSMVERFATYFPTGTPFSYILGHMIEICATSSRFFVAKPREYLMIARLIDNIHNMSVEDRFTLCAVPIGKDTPFSRELIDAYGHCIVNQDGGNILDIPVLKLEILDKEPIPDKDYLAELEQLHMAVVCYLWLSYRFAGIFNTRPLAFHIKGLVEAKIEHTLSIFSWVDRAKKRAARRRQILQLTEASEWGEPSSGQEIVAPAISEDIPVDAPVDEPGMGNDNAQLSSVSSSQI